MALASSMLLINAGLPVVGYKPVLATNAVGVDKGLGAGLASNYPA